MADNAPLNEQIIILISFAILDKKNNNPHVICAYVK
jgi:hypothetical protein